MSRAMTGAQIVLEALADQGVEHIFGYPGGAVLPIYDELFQQDRIKHILVRHEQGAVHAAEGYARSTGKVGVVLVTSGPGATNAVTGLTDALMDSVPVVCLTGQVPTHLIGNDAFQEADTTGITRPCTKHNYLVKAVADLARTVHEAFYVARSGRPGPVVIDLPKDVLMNKHDYVAPKKPVQHKSYRPQVKPELKKVEEAIELIGSAKRPVFYAGGGIVNAGPKASKLLTQFVHMTGYPITNTLMGLGSFPASDKQFLGMLGMHGTAYANHAVGNCDPTPATLGWTVDTTAPDTQITGGPSGAVASTTATFAFAIVVAEAGSYLQCSLDGAAFATCTSPTTYTNLAQRLNYSLGAFHLTSVYDPNLDRFRFERRYGALAGLSYPLSRFQRLETTLVGRVAEREAEDAAIYGVGTRSLLVSNFSSFIHVRRLLPKIPPAAPAHQPAPRQGRESAFPFSSPARPSSAARRKRHWRSHAEPGSPASSPGSAGPAFHLLERAGTHNPRPSPAPAPPTISRVALPAGVPHRSHPQSGRTGRRCAMPD